MRVLLQLAAMTGVALSVTPLAAQDIDKGRQVYHEYLCYSCHGYNGVNIYQPLANDLSGIMVNESVFITFLRQRAELNPATASRAMPNYAETALSDQQAKDLYAYIKTLKDDTPDVNEDPLMQQILDAAKSANPSGQ